MTFLTNGKRTATRGGIQIVATDQKAAAATLEELQKLTGATSDFIVAQLALRSTLDEARLALVQDLYDKIAEARNELEMHRANSRF